MRNIEAVSGRHSDAICQSEHWTEIVISRMTLTEMRSGAICEFLESDRPGSYYSWYFLGHTKSYIRFSDPNVALEFKMRFA